MKWLVIQSPGVHLENRDYREALCVRRALTALGDECFWASGPESASALGGVPVDAVILLEQYPPEEGWLMDMLHRLKAFPRWEHIPRLQWQIDAHCVSSLQYEDMARLFRPTTVLQASRNYLTRGSLWFPNCVDDFVFFDMKLSRTLKPCIACQRGFPGRDRLVGAVYRRLEKSVELIWPERVLGQDYARFLSKHAVGLNVNIGCDINYRTFEVPACGGLLLSTGKNRLAPLGFLDGKNCLLFSTAEEAADKYLWAVNHPEKLREMAEAGKALVLRHHTYRVRMKQLKEYLAYL